MKLSLTPIAGAMTAIGMAGAAYAAPAPVTPAAATEAQIAQVDAIFARWAHQDTPGCAVAVSRGSEILAQRVYGMASLELGVPAKQDSIYEAGSDSKQFTAAATLMLAREGKLSLDDDIRKYVPEMPDYGAPITIRHLLHHTSGLRDWGSVAAIEGWPRNSRTADNKDMLDILVRQKQLNFAPGAHYLYSNSNFNLLAIIVQRVSGQSLADFTHDRIFVPLGMSHTRWRDDHGEVVPGRTGAYEFENGVYRNDQVIEDAYGNGGLLTTVDDLVKWQAALDDDRFGPGFTEAMQQPTRLNDGTRIAYALAVVNLDHHGEQEVSHSGSTGGYRAWMARYPRQKLAVSLLCNGGNADTPTLGRDVADVFLPAFKSRPYTPKGPLPTGLYADGMTGFPVRFAADAQGQLTADGRALEPVGPGRWALREDVFAFSKSGLVRENREGERIAYRKVEQVSAFDPKDYAGRFCGVDTGGCLTFRQQGDTLVYDGPRWSGRPLTAAYADVFTGDALPQSSSMTVKFRRDAGGKVTSLRFGESRAYDVEFRRTDG
ncbi:CubicO group peptidase (beta-lactamase class C family) [Novosphingobium sp. PhB55]|uniref:serine hydrolase domain-containing protein n=1 Tax=unclassified Novosphingobium TaxID=2644732 RepID=UPI0010667923|nr:serine hydrolase domain-containing protein [Novosphingobium sp. PhB55]TDW64364.1 CubicO group peptidase (beta-lactamase class C family) [Novosphingobium sp. PhB55]